LSIVTLKMFGLFDSVVTIFSDRRTGRNIQHEMTSLLRRSVYSRLAGYEDVNDAQRLSLDSVMFYDFMYLTASWDRSRRVVVKVEWHQG